MRAGCPHPSHEGAGVLPRFFLVLGHQKRGQMVPAWPGGGRANCPAPADGEWVAWRVVGGNHREIGRSAGVFVDADAARDNIASVRDSIEDAVASTEAVRGLWGWQLYIDGLPMVVSSRVYRRARDCGDSLATAVAGIRIAELRDVVPRLRR